MKIETQRLILRPLKIGDAGALAKLWTDPEVTRYMGGPRNYEEIYAEFIEETEDKSPPRFNLWPVMEKATGQLIGHCGLIDKEVDGTIEFELVYVLVKSAWGKGYATEIANAIADYAFIQFGLKRIISLIDINNKASEYVAKKIGMRYEKDVVRESGKIVHIYSKNREDYAGV